MLNSVKFSNTASSKIDRDSEALNNNFNRLKLLVVKLIRISQNLWGKQLAEARIKKDFSLEEYII